MILLVAALQLVSAGYAAAAVNIDIRHNETSRVIERKVAESKQKQAKVMALAQKARQEQQESEKSLSIDRKKAGVLINGEQVFQEEQPFQAFGEDILLKSIEMYSGDDPDYPENMNLTTTTEYTYNAEGKVLTETEYYRDYARVSADGYDYVNMKTVSESVDHDYYYVIDSKSYYQDAESGEWVLYSCRYYEYEFYYGFTGRSYSYSIEDGTKRYTTDNEAERDELGRLTASRSYSINSSTGEKTLSSEVIYTYDDDGFVYINTKTYYLGALQYNYMSGMLRSDTISGNITYNTVEGEFIPAAKNISVYRDNYRNDKTYEYDKENSSWVLKNESWYIDDEEKGYHEYYNLYTGNYTYGSKGVYQVDDKDRRTYEESYDYDTETETWTGSYKTETEYEDTDDYSIETTIRYEFINGEWVKSSKSIIKTDNRLDSDTFTSYSNWDEETQSWVLSEEYGNDYVSIGDQYLISCDYYLSLSYNAYNGNKVDYTYNEAGDLTSVKEYLTEDNTEELVWVLNRQTDVTYTENSVVTTTYSSYESGQWQSINRSTVLKDENGRVLSETEESKYIYSEWETERMTEYTYSADDMNYIAVSYVYYNGERTPDSKMEYTILDDQKTECITYSADYDYETLSWVWIVSQKTIQDEIGSYFESYYWDSDMEVWVGDTFNEIYYDEDGTRTGNASYEWDYSSNKWVGEYKSISYYGENRGYSYYYDWDDEKGWFGTDASVWTDDMDGNGTRTKYIWDSEAWDWQPSTKVMYSSAADENHELMENCSLKWDAAAGEWVVDFSRKFETVYRPDHNYDYTYSESIDTDEDGVVYKSVEKRVYNYATITGIKPHTEIDTVIMAMKGGVQVMAPAGTPVSVTTVGGVNVFSAEGSVTRSLPQGVYIINVGGQATRVLIR